ncbi:MAG TPA: hypothetical protein VLT86_09110 [Vicinamibacterales bacterium]|nr:hypothetical protein [Vicinamibacterales bacterium]
MSASSRGMAAVVVAGLLAAASLAAQQEHLHPAQPEKLGTVHFETSCQPAAQASFDRAMALLHSFEFGPAIQGFTATLATDSGCAIAYWGIALARWGNPFAAVVRQPPQLQQGLDAIVRARAAAAKTARERAYIEAAAKLYVDFDKVDQRARVVAYCAAMEQLAGTYPDDHEASIFYALSLTASALPTDKTYANQLKAGAILEKLYFQQPDHPGIAHYIIHTYDVPALADQALDAARSYAKIAPSAPHALHMPSHTFTRVGAWQESIDTNILSADAARREGATAEELHAMDYLTYAYLQTGQDRAVQALTQALPDVARRLDVNAVGSAAPGSAGVFAIAAIPVRWALERRDWRAAAALEPRSTQFPYAEAMTYFARALGAARTGALPQARASVDALQQIEDRLTQTGEAYWAEQTEIQRLGASAYLAFAEGKPNDALQLMRTAAEREDATEKNAVTPGPVAPARELLGDLLLDLKQPAAALAEYQATLKKEPNRFRALYGAAKAASLAGDQLTARTLYAQLLTVCVKADRPGRSELDEARKATGQTYATPRGETYGR